MRRRPNNRGFTIIETLIFLVVSSFVFIAAISQYSNQQHAVQFRQGVRDIQSQLQSMISDVATSYTPDISTYNCTADTLNNPLVMTPASSPPDNSGCIFLGKAIGVGNDVYCDKSSVDNCARYSIIPIIGRRNYYSTPTAVGQPVSTFKQAQPLALSTCLTHGDYWDSIPCGSSTLPGGPTSRPDLAKRSRFHNVGVYRMFVRNMDGSSKQNIGAIAFMQNLDSTSSTSINNVNLVWLDVPFLYNTESNVTDAISKLGSSASDATYINPPYGVTLCIMDGYGQKSAIMVGGNKSQLDVQVEPVDKLDSGCN